MTQSPANTWDEVNALHDELCALDGGNLLPGIAEEGADRLSPAGRLCALILPRTELMSREFYLPALDAFWYLSANWA